MRYVIRKFSVILFFKTLFIIFNFQLMGKSPNLIKDLLSSENHYKFVEILESNPLFLSLLNNNKYATIYAPTDIAFQNMPDKFKNDLKKYNVRFTTKLILSHIFSGDNLNKKGEEDGMVLTLDGSIYFTYEAGDLYVKDIVSQGKAFRSGYY